MIDNYIGISISRIRKSFQSLISFFILLFFVPELYYPEITKTLSCIFVARRSTNRSARQQVASISGLNQFPEIILGTTSNRLSPNLLAVSPNLKCEIVIDALLIGSRKSRVFRFCITAH